MATKFISHKKNKKHGICTQLRYLYKLDLIQNKMVSYTTAVQKSHKQ